MDRAGADTPGGPGPVLYAGTQGADAGALRSGRPLRCHRNRRGGQPLQMHRGHPGPGGRAGRRLPGGGLPSFRRGQHPLHPDHALPGPQPGQHRHLRANHPPQRGSHHGPFGPGPLLAAGTHCLPPGGHSRHCPPPHSGGCGGGHRRPSGRRFGVHHQPGLLRPDGKCGGHCGGVPPGGEGPAGG